jgi:RNase P protein component
MVINMTLGFVKAARGSCFAGTGLVGIACAKVATPRAGVIAIKKTINKKIERRLNMRLLRRWLLLRAPRLLVCLRRESLGGQCLG